jgi:hypothetical protein
MELGFSNHGWFLALSVLFSLGAVVLFERSLRMLLGAQIAFWGVLFYVTSYSFLAFADVIANQPIDDLLRFLFVFLTVCEFKHSDTEKQHRFYLGSLAVQALLSISSLDSVFFVFIWRILFDVLFMKKFRFKAWVPFMLVPIAVYGIQVMQNIWYLGWDDAMLDFRLALHDRGVRGNEENPFSMFVFFRNLLNQILHGSIFWNIRNLLGLMLPAPTWATWVGFLLPFVGMVFLRSFDVLRLSIVFLIAGMAFTFVLPGAGMVYEGRQILPLASLLFAWSIVSGSHLLKGVQERFHKLVGWVLVASSVVLLSASVSNGSKHWNMLVGETFYHPHLMSTTVDYPPQRELRWMRSLRNKWGENQVFLNWKGLSKVPPYVPGYPQPDDMYEYYGDAPVLGFDQLEGLAVDLDTLDSKIGGTWTPVVLTKEVASFVNFMDKNPRWVISDQFVGPDGLVAAHLIRKK